MDSKFHVEKKLKRLSLANKKPILNIVITQHLEQKAQNILSWINEENTNFSNMDFVWIDGHLENK